MEINVYQPCPCHPEKKIKFCCGKDVVHELDQVIVKHRARQSRAAVEDLDRLIAKFGDRDCLLTTKVTILRSLGDSELALQVNSAFLKKNPRHFLGLEQQAAILAELDRPLDAVQALQDAMDSLPTAEIPLSFSLAFQDVAVSLAKAQHFIAAIEHARFAVELKSNEESKAVYGDVLAAAVRDEAFALRSLLPPPLQNPAAAWFKKADNASRALRRGQFRKAAQLADRGLEMAPDARELLLLSAIARTALADGGAAEAWRAFSRAEGLVDSERIEAEVFAQMALDRQAPKPTSISEVYEFKEFDRVCDELRSIDRLVEIPSDAAMAAQGARAVFFILDRVKPGDDDEITRENFPVVLGQAAIYGRRTDREPELVLIGNEQGWHRELAARLETANGGPLVLRESAKRELSVSEDRFLEQPSWIPFHGLSQQRMRGIARDQFRHYLLQEWLDRPLFELAGQRPRDAAQLPDCHKVLLAWLWRAERRHSWLDVADIVAEAREALALKPPAAIGFDRLTWHPPSLLQLKFVEMTTVPTNELLGMLFPTRMFGIGDVALSIADELLKRSDLPDSVRLYQLHVLRATYLHDDDECLRVLSTAREIAIAGGHDDTSVLLARLDICLTRGRFHDVMAIIDELGTRPQSHELREQLDAIFARHGLLTEEGQYVIPRASAEEPAAEAGGGLWTPDQAEAQTAGRSTGGSGLWLPGS